MTRSKLRCIPLAILLALGALSTTVRAASPVTVTIQPDAAKDTKEISPDFLGVSYETEKILPDAQGRYYFSPDNKQLLQMFQTLGIKSLRVGGNTADRPTVKIPGPADLDQLFAFAKAADVKVIYTLRMRQGDSKAAAETAKYILDHYKDLLTCFAIGNEPNIFAKEYPPYLAAWKDYAKDVTALAPQAKFCGPSATPGKQTWAKDFAHDMADSGLVVLITQHDYPGASARAVTDTAAARQKMLSPDWIKYNEKFAAKFVPEVKQSKLPFRLEEANSFYNGGAKDVSDTLASALWGLDYLYWWASEGASGINLHTGDKVAAGEDNAVCRYAVFTSSDDGYAARPIAYAVKAFDISGHGRLVPAKISANEGELNLRAYAVVKDPNNLSVVLINKEYEKGHDATVTIASGGVFTNGGVMYLTGPEGDVAATTGIKLSGFEIGHDGRWEEEQNILNPSAAAGEFKVNVPAASAAIVQLYAASKASK